MILFVFTIIMTNYTLAQIPGLHQETLYDIRNHAISNQVTHVSVGKNPIKMDIMENKLYVVNAADNSGKSFT